MGETRRKKSLRRAWNRSVDNIKMDLKAIGWVDLHSIHVTQDRDNWRVVVDSAINCRAPEICDFSFRKSIKGKVRALRLPQL